MTIDPLSLKTNSSPHPIEQILQMHLAEILDMMKSGLMVVDANGYIDYVNLAWETLVNYQREQVQGIRLTDLISLDISEAQTKWIILDNIQMIVETVREGQKWNGLLHLLRPNGGRYDVQVNIEPILSQQNELRFLIMLDDVTKSVEADQKQEVFLEDFAHEIRTPLTNLKVYQTLLERDSGHLVKERLAILQQELGRLELLLKDIVDFAQIKHSAWQTPYSTVNLNDVIEEVVGAYTSELQNRQLDLSVRLDKHLPPICGDYNRLIQLITNLLTNAIKYTPANGMIGISTYCWSNEQNNPAHVMLTVEDAGIGIPERDLPLIFERFFRGSNARDLSSVGSGLGLSIVNEIVTMHKGQIEVISTEGRGTSFMIMFPVRSTP